jgi:hypothetical protein
MGSTRRGCSRTTRSCRCWRRTSASTTKSRRRVCQKRSRLRRGPAPTPLHRDRLARLRAGRCARLPPKGLGGRPTVSTHSLTHSLAGSACRGLGCGGAPLPSPPPCTGHARGLGSMQRLLAWVVCMGRGGCPHSRSGPSARRSTARWWSGSSRISSRWSAVRRRIVLATTRLQRGVTCCNLLRCAATRRAFVREHRSPRHAATQRPRQAFASAAAIA